MPETVGAGHLVLLLGNVLEGAVGSSCAICMVSLPDGPLKALSSQQAELGEKKISLKSHSITAAVNIQLLQY